MERIAKILIIEDEHYYESLIRHAFNNYKNKYETSFAMSLAHGLSFIKSSEVDLVIADIVLPDGLGFSIVDYLKSNNLNIPVIFITSRGNEEMAIRSFKMGVMDYLIKAPEVFKELPELSEKVLNEWQEKERQKVISTQLKESEKKYRNLVENISDVVWIIDRTFSRYTFINSAVEKFLGVKPKEMMYLPVNHFLAYESSKKVEQLFKSVRKNAKKGRLDRVDPFNRMELIFEHKDGSTRWGEVKSNLLIENEKIVGLSGVTRDITDKKIAEARNQELLELRQKMKVSERVSRIKEQFLANMNHEIRTPMTGIMGMTELLMNTPLNEIQKFYLTTIQSSSGSLLNFVDKILDLSRIKAGKAELNPVVFDLEEHGRLTLILFSALIEQKGLSSSFYYDPELPRLIRADEYRLGQIISNLLSNAIKFTDNGFIKVSYSLKSIIDKELVVRVEIVDSGIGINEDDKNKLFEIFSQIDTSDTRPHDGAGLGLPLSQRFARMMGGEIGLTSTPGKGSQFWLEFKAERIFQEKQDACKADQEAVAGKCEGRILLVEDKKTNQLVVSLMLKEFGCQVDIACHGQEALDKFGVGKYKLIIMDIQMPVMDGLTAVKELHKRYGKEKLPPIVGLSAKGDPDYFISEGLDDFITKPVSSATLHRKVNQWINKKQR